MSPPSDTGRMHRSLAAVEARYVRELGRRTPSSSQAARPAAGAKRRRAAKRPDLAHGRVRAEVADGRPRRPVL